MRRTKGEPEPAMVDLIIVTHKDYGLMLAKSSRRDNEVIQAKLRQKKSRTKKPRFNCEG